MSCVPYPGAEAAASLLLCSHLAPRAKDPVGRKTDVRVRKLHRATVRLYRCDRTLITALTRRKLLEYRPLFAASWWRRTRPKNTKKNIISYRDIHTHTAYSQCFTPRQFYEHSRPLRSVSKNIAKISNIKKCCHSLDVQQPKKLSASRGFASDSDRWPESLPVDLDEAASTKPLYTGSHTVFWSTVAASCGNSRTLILQHPESYPTYCRTCETCNLMTL